MEQNWKDVAIGLQDEARANEARIAKMEAALKAAKKYIAALEYAADGYYKVEQSAECEKWRAAIKEKEVQRVAYA